MSYLGLGRGKKDAYPHQHIVADLNTAKRGSECQKTVDWGQMSSGTPSLHSCMLPKTAMHFTRHLVASEQLGGQIITILPSQCQEQPIRISLEFLHCSIYWWGWGGRVYKANQGFLTPTHCSQVSGSVCSRSRHNLEPSYYLLCLRTAKLALEYCFWPKILCITFSPRSKASDCNMILLHAIQKKI